MISLLGSLTLFPSILRCRGAVPVIQRDFSFRPVFGAVKAQPQKEAAECVFLFVHRLLRNRHPLGVFTHLAECGNEVGVGFSSIGIVQLLEPRKRHPVLHDFKGKLADPQSFPYQFALGFQQLSKIAQRYLIKRDFHRKPHVRLLWLVFTCLG